MPRTNPGATTVSKKLNIRLLALHEGNTCKTYFNIIIFQNITLLNEQKIKMKWTGRNKRRENMTPWRGCKRDSMEESVKKEQRHKNATGVLDMWSGRRQWQLKSRYQIVNGI